MNSAPIQLLPTSYGNEPQKKISENVKAGEPVRRFDEVLESAVREKDGGNDPVQPKQEKNGLEPVSADSEKQPGKEAAQDGHEETHQSMKSAGKSEVKTDDGKKPKKAIKDAKASLQVEDEGEKLAAFFAAPQDQPKSEEVKDGKNGKFEAKSVVTKLSGKTEVSEILKAAPGNLGAAAPEIAKDKKSKEDKGGKKTEAGGKLSQESAESLLKTVSARKGAKPHASTAASFIISGDKDGKTAEAGSKSGKSDSRLRVVDHRKAQAVPENGSQFKLYADNTAQNLSTGAEDAGQPIELNAQSDTLRIDGRQADVKNQQSAVLTQLKEGVNDQIVKQAGIIVKADGSGEIKLVMKPEQLGKVRIQLSLNDNHIAGRIIVENNIVREIFESNLENLYKAFGTEGFENGGLEVSVQGEGAGDSGKHRAGGMNRRAVQAIEDAVPEIVDTEWQSNAVNMVV